MEISNGYHHISTSIILIFLFQSTLVSRNPDLPDLRGGQLLRGVRACPEGAPHWPEAAPEEAAPASHGPARVHRDPEDLLAVDPLHQGSPGAHPEGGACCKHSSMLLISQFAFQDDILHNSASAGKPKILVFVIYFSSFPRPKLTQLLFNRMLF